MVRSISVKAISFFIALSTLLVSQNAFGKFEFIVNPQGNWEVKTITKNDVGLGQMMRELGLKPNWKNRSWIREIYKLNPNVMQSDGHIVQPNTQIQFPVDALRDCEGYQGLLTFLNNKKASYLQQRAQVSTPATTTNQPAYLNKKNPTSSPVTPEVEPTEENVNYSDFDEVQSEETSFEASVNVSAQPQILDQSTESAPTTSQELSNSTGLPTKEVKTSSNLPTVKKFNARIWAAAGISTNENQEENTNTSTELGTPYTYLVGLEASYDLLRQLQVQGNFRFENRKYDPPANLIVTQDDENHLSYGLGAGYKVGRHLISTFVENSSLPISELVSGTTLAVGNESFLNVGLSWGASFSLINANDLFFKLGGSYFLSKDIEGINYDGGFGARVVLDYTILKMGLYTGLEYNYIQLDRTGVTNTTQDAFAKLGYKF